MTDFALTLIRGRLSLAAVYVLAVVPVTFLALLIVESTGDDTASGEGTFLVAIVDGVIILDIIGLWPFVSFIFFCAAIGQADGALLGLILSFAGFCFP